MSKKFKVRRENSKRISINFCIIAADLSAVARGQNAKTQQIALGVTLPNTMVVFERGEGSSINLAGKSKGYGETNRRNIHI